MSKKLIIFHLVTVIQYLSATYYNANYVVVPKTEQFKQFHGFGGLAKYLTLWNMLVQSVFFWICLLNDLIGSNDICIQNQPLIRRFKDIFFCSISFPLSAFVSVTFWTLYTVDRELVLPKVMDNYFPTWLNHIMHTNILIFSLIELISAFRVYPSHKKGLGILSAFMFMYLIWLFIIYFKTGHWVYPVMDVLSWPQKAVFLAFLLVAAQGFYMAGEMLNKIIWSEELNAVYAEAMKKADRRKKCH